MVTNMMHRVKSAFVVFVLMASILAMTSLLAVDDSDDPVTARMTQASYTIDVNGTVMDEVGRNITGATVHIRGNTSSWTTNDSGFFEIYGLADDVASYTFYADKPGYIKSDDFEQLVSGNQTYTVNLMIRGGTILGLVTSSSGFIENASVSISALGYSTNVSSANGTYSLGGVPGGTHSVTASAPGYDPKTEVASLSAGGAVQVNFLLVSLAGEIAGFVLHTGTLAPLNNSVVSVNLTDKTVTVNTGTNGSYLIPVLPEGTYTLTASKDGFYTVVMAGVQVTKGVRTENVNFTLTEKPTLLYGTVKSGALLLPNVVISVVGTSFSNKSNSIGNYSIENITAGEYTVSATLEGYATAQIEKVLIPVGGSVRLDIDLVALPGAVLRGLVMVRGTDSALINVAVTIITPGGLQRSTVTNAFGQFEFTQLSAGNHTLQFKIEGYKPMERVVQVRSDEITNETFYLEPLRKGFEGFIFGFDLAHSMMILALFLTILILAMAVYLRIRTFQAPESAPAVYDEAEEEGEKKEGAVAEATKEQEKRQKNDDDGG